MWSRPCVPVHLARQRRSPAPAARGDHAPSGVHGRAHTASGDRQRQARLRRLLDRIKEAVQVHRGVERRQAALPGPDRRGEQGVHLPDVERIAAGEVGRDKYEALGDRQLAQRVAADDATAPLASRPLTSKLSGAVTSTSCCVSVSYHCRAWVVTTHASRAKLPATKRKANMSRDV